ncbi:MAG: hypothetical protein ACD_38C00035G0008 [uncultured bacterium]|nr:MAG: hypothetical protein ACD_38C00035G0008 [uncultured bacterium]OGE21911.1 MAG: hypothetical protein A2778_00185 [Candidatus Daviesbacteria bacterium RIFCSPHIGHO2_01_FULL_40_24]OGE29143.1 MAG: hypothetical protein A3C29_04900 [Candidatus Daviesbacteria bacterium RIFCSPHIGHO2_02_FULL_40_16]OGE43098.1 MAG: hypothetical protein A3A53_00905 [Candidatus Daviesbacteria bacterium RIFCSPLOWO2_01_FULL_39_23]OGE67440.1 MAG: hypothetical protein A3J16_03825 [Candidatus Daviesbacteria bacterium RIFCSP
MKFSKRGFTLIELLVVIAIIAVLSMVGIAVYTDIGAGARNAKRMGDIDAIAKALEVHQTSNGYIPLANSQFGSGGIPLTDSQRNVYCGNSTQNDPADPTAFWGITCPTSYGVLGAHPQAGTSWKICAWLEGAGGENAKAYCRSNAE